MRTRLRTWGSMWIVVATPVLWGAPATANEDGYATIRRSLAPYAVPPPIAGPNLGTPADLIAQSGELVWNGDPADERLGWVAFQEPPFDRALSVEAVSELIRNLCPDAVADSDVTSDGTFVLHVERDQAQAIEVVLDWLMGAIVPTLRVQARLERTAPESRLRAVGHARLVPNRWMPVFFRKDEIPYVVGYDIEIAQEAVVADPQIANLVEGSELYLRFHPGERLSLVEVWVSDVEHVDVHPIDLTNVRIAPAANELGVLNAPQTAVDRAHTCFVVPTGQRVVREIAWARKGRRQRLQLALDVPSPAPPIPLPGEAPRAARIVHTGAVASALEFNGRAQREHLFEPLQDAFDPETFEPFVQGALGVLCGTPDDVKRIATAWQRHEAALVEHTVTLDLWRVPEAAFRAALDRGELFGGQPLPASVREALQQAGAQQCESVRLPVLSGVGSAFRIGESVPGVIDFDVNVAQQSGALEPVSWSLFRGIFGDLVVTGSADRTVLRATGELVWADVAAGSADLAFRPARSLRAPGAQAPLPARKVNVPLLSGGSVSYDDRIELSATGDTLLHASVQGDEVSLLLARTVSR